MTDPAYELPDPADLYMDVLPDVDAELDQLAEAYASGATDMQLVEQLAGLDEAWKASNDTEADAAMAMLAQADGQIAALDRQHIEYQERGRQWHDRVTGPLVRRRDYWWAVLQEYGLRRRSETAGKVKTVRLPSGDVATRKGAPPRPQIEDPAAVLAWALDMRDGGRTGLVRVRMLIDVLLSDVARHVAVVPAPNGEDGYVVVDAETGEVVPGMGWAQTPPSATPKPYETA